MLFVEVLQVGAVGCHFLLEGLYFGGLVADGCEQAVEFFIVDRHGVLVLHPHDEVGEGVHVVGEGIVGGVVGGEVGVCGAVGEVFCRHVEEVVGGLEASPVLFKLAVVAQTHALGHGVELGEGLVLEFVAQPCRGVAGFIGPRHRERHFEFGHRLEELHGLGGGGEFHAAFGGEAGQRLEELEYARFALLEFAEGLEVHEQIEYLLLLGGVGNPGDVFVGGEGIFVPGGVGEAVGDILRELVVLEQELEFGLRGGGVDVVGRFPAEDVLGAFGDAPLVAHGVDLRGELVGVDQLRVSEHLGCHTEQRLDFLLVEVDLYAEFLGVGQRGQRVVVCLGQEFAFACFGKFAQEVDEFGHILLALLQGHARDGDGAAESAAGILDHAQQRFCGGYIGAVCDAGYYVVVGKVVIIIMRVADVEETVVFEAERLVYLEIEADCFHGCRF